MTDQLRALIAAATCPRCLGNGRLADRELCMLGGTPMLLQETRPCAACGETGIAKRALHLV